ncbi:phosphatase PAP2 family protein [Novosphingobium sp. 9U]|uniref:phosphatase PAP2 family protein n=1 Tax=Novosphingobium sp. 9U TaxID=2653158 RepID=UPI0012F23186|nr:phosphatase PAP2 family protein [Novosphingobium sp. 9U]VWX54043.1 Undecaprenyl-diphosphatase [Novosphingobium sp. 9U]
MLARPRILLASARTRIAGHEALDPLRSLFNDLSEREIKFVELAWRGTRRPGIRALAISISWLGNGAIYPIIALPLWYMAHWVARPLVAAALSMAIAHLLYPWLKAACARSRPCNLRDSLEPLLASLDEHSFPSGHAMTLAAALIPLVQAVPIVWPLALGFWLAMAWARMGCGHHYPSDIAAGGLLGATIALPITFLS